LDTELLINVNSIWKIEILYFLPNGDKQLLMTSPTEAASNPDAIRYYHIFFGSEEGMLGSDPNNAAAKVIEEIYRNATKG